MILGSKVKVTPWFKYVVAKASTVMLGHKSPPSSYGFVSRPDGYHRRRLNLAIVFFRTFCVICICYYFLVQNA